MSLLPSGAIETGGYDINNSLRFRSSASAYLSRTPASAGNRKTWTWSGWVKRGSLGSTHTLLSTTNGSGTYTEIRLINDVIGIQSNLIAAPNEWLTNAVFRDPSAWYHIVVTVDTTAATAADRIKVWVNSNTQTFSQSPTVTLNGDLYINAAVSHSLGRRDTGSLYFDGYLAEVNFIDGSAKTPSDFGETDAVTGVWKAKKYTGTYGTNGFYLKFSDIATTSGSNAGLGKDFSGNTNYWTTNNISVTSGTTYDAMTDVPTNTSATVANYAVLSPLDWVSASGTLSAGNLNWASSTNVCGNKSTIGATSGKWYWEAVGSSVTSGTIGGRFGFTGSDTIAAEQDKFGMYWHPTSGIARIVNGTNTYVTSAYTYTNSDVLALALDLDNNISYWYKNGVLQYTYDFSSYSTIGSRVFHAYVWNASSGTPSWVYNFGQRPFAYTPRTNHLALNTYNLPDSTIKKGNSYMDATTYTGTLATLNINNNAGFSPSLVWIKSRSAAGNNNVYDAVRGATLELETNFTNAEATISNGLTSFNSNGFTLGNNAGVNASGTTYVAWQWQAGQGSTSSNTSGSITSTVSVNTTAGFSIVTYTGTGANATVGHGLGVAPKMIIVKARNNADNWLVYNSNFSSPTGDYLILNSTAAKGNVAGYWNGGATSTVFGLGAYSAINGAYNYVAYCFAEIAGFSKFGSYTGNGSADGPFVYTGFRPKYVLFKNASLGTADWQVYDTARDTYNAAGLDLLPNTSAAQTDSRPRFDFLSNGIKIRTSGAGVNGSGNTIIYATFAENPTKYALAR